MAAASLDAQGTSDLIHIGYTDGETTVWLPPEPIPPDAYSLDPEADPPAGKKPERGPKDKVHPMLGRWHKESVGGERVRVIVSFEEEVPVPQFPEIALGEPLQSFANRAALARTEELIRGVEARRAPRYAAHAEKLGRRFGARVLETFWLTSAMLVEVPLAAVPELAELAEIRYLEPEAAGTPPPQSPTVSTGRGQINSDLYFSAAGLIGLLDTGVRPTHVQLSNPSHLGVLRDCMAGTSAGCLGGTQNPVDDFWNHGTSSAAILTANSNQGNAYRGVTGITVDSFKVYDSNGLDTAAAVRGFQAAVARLDKVIVAEMQDTGSETGSVAAAADSAFDAGAVVIAANGNDGPNSGTVRSPANAHKVLGVGAYDVTSLATESYQSRGPAGDGRIKPDIQAPTNTWTASNSSDQATQAFGGTSGATPYAAGAAALLRSWMNVTEPGHVYARMILAGQQPAFNNNEGAGKLYLPGAGKSFWGKVTVSHGQTVNISLHICSYNPQTLDAALWWPESASQAHNNIDLTLLDPAGSVRATSTSEPSVFERARVPGPLTKGYWTLRVQGVSVPTGSQVVYWSGFYTSISLLCNETPGSDP